MKRKVLTKVFVGLFIAICGITSVSAMHLKKEPVSIKVGQWHQLKDLDIH